MSFSRGLELLEAAPDGIRGGVDSYKRLDVTTRWLRASSCCGTIDTLASKYIDRQDPTQDQNKAHEVYSFCATTYNQKLLPSASSP